MIFQEHIYPFKEQSVIINPETHHSPRLLGSSPTITCSTQIPQFPPQCTNTSIVASTSSERSKSSPSPLEEDQSLPVESESHNSHYSSSVLPTNDNSSEFSNTGHLPSADPLSPSNLDSHNSNSHIKTHRLFDIIRTIDSVNAPHTTKFPLPTYLHVSSSIPPEPVNFSSAIKQPKWIEAMKEEFDSLTHNKTWKLVPQPHNRPIIGCKWIYKNKSSPDGTSHKYKAHLVAKGFLKERGIDYHETFSPVIKVTTI